MFAQFRDQDHPFPAIVLQGECNIEVGNYEASPEVGLTVTLAPLGLTGPWCAALCYLSIAEAETLSAELAIAIGRARMEMGHGT